MLGQATHPGPLGARGDISDLKARVDFAEVVNRYVPLKLRGVELWACCPFHRERTPSFKVDRRRQRFVCFGCGAGGDALDFLARIERLDAAGAVRRLRELVGAPEASARHSAPSLPLLAHGSDPGAERNRELARAIWRESEAVGDGPPHRYLLERLERDLVVGLGGANRLEPAAAVRRAAGGRS